MASVKAGLRDWWRRNRVTSKRLAVGAVAVWLGCVGLEWMFFGHEGPWIVFYGRVIDRAGRPVRGAVVTVVVEKGKNFLARGQSFHPDLATLRLTTGDDGEFEVRGIRGVYLSVRFYNRDHYFEVNDPRRSTGEYFYDAEYVREVGRRAAVYKPDARRPAVFVVERER